ncbi:nucleotidyl transferase AbiEii/AbiGii toxin family protein [Klebsiella pneumoniae]
MLQSVHIIIKSLYIEGSLNEMMVMKGGTLLGVKHGSDRYTKDIYFST